MRYIGGGINDAIATHQARVSVSLHGVTTIAANATRIVLMDDDLAQ